MGWHIFDRSGQSPEHGAGGNEQPSAGPTVTVPGLPDGPSPSASPAQARRTMTQESLVDNGAEGKQGGRETGGSGSVTGRRAGLWGIIIFLVIFLLTKFKWVLFLLTKLKFATTGLTMLASVWAYSLLWGWKFAALFVLLLFIHELGHVIELRRVGIPASAPDFIHFLGAAVLLKKHPQNALIEARVGLAGPIIGSAAAAAMWLTGVMLDSDLLRAAAFVGFALNLFNLIPITPLDGGRAVAALHPLLWLVGVAAMGVLVVVTLNPIVIIITLIAALNVLGRMRSWYENRSATPDGKDPSMGPEGAAYYTIGWKDRLIIALVYLGLLAFLAWAMQGSFVPVLA